MTVDQEFPTDPAVKLIIDFLHQYPDETRHPYVVDNDDWEELYPVLHAMEEILINSYIVQDQNVDRAWRRSLRVLLEVMYMRGYMRGKDEANIPSMGYD